jgi:hypothetical protein
MSLAKADIGAGGGGGSWRHSAAQPHNRPDSSASIATVRTTPQTHTQVARFRSSSTEAIAKAPYRIPGVIREPTTPELTVRDQARAEQVAGLGLPFPPR